MRFSWQNLKESSSRREWLHGRAWLRLREGHRSRFGTLRVEWQIGPTAHVGWGIEFGGEDNGILVNFSIPFLLSLWVGVSNVWKRTLIPWTFEQGRDRRIDICFFERAIWWHIWVGGMASWSRKYPWCQWWRQGSFHFANLLGKESYSCETLREGIPVQIQMPEGVYRGTAKVERARWKRPLWLARERVSTYIDVPSGIPFQGKGENAWDCGDDGLFGAEVEGESVERAVAHFAETVLRNRKKYGAPSREAIVQALAVSAR